MSDPKCVVCGKVFKPSKTYFKACDSCFKSNRVVKCRTCKCVVYEKDGHFYCCGHKEVAAESITKNQVKQQIIKEQLDKIFPPMILDDTDYDEQNDEFAVYNIPNT